MSKKYDNLILIPHYAEKIGVTKQAVYKQVREGKHKIVVIDGIKFIDLKKSPIK